MDRIISDITDRHVARLPGDRQYFRMDDIRGTGMPSFLIRRLHLQMRRNLRDSLAPLRSEWSDLQAEEVARRWKAFAEAAEEELRLPSGRAREVVEEAVAGCLELLTSPRKTMPRVLFENDGELSREELNDRLEWVVVYRHFHSLVPRYMEKKGLETLSRERFESIIAKADRRLCERYDTAEWAGLLEPLFKLTEGEVPPNLLARFFRDKELPAMAARFEDLEGAVDRSRLTEVLDGRQGTPAAEPEPSHRKEPQQANLNTLFSEPEPEPEQEEEPETQPAVEREAEPAPDKSMESESDADATPMWMRYLDPEEQKRLEEEEERKRLEEGEQMADFDPPEKDRRLEPDASKSDEQGPEVEDEPEFEQEAEFRQEPLIDLAGSSDAQENANGRSAKHLKSLLQDEREYFIEEIFRGSVRAYDRALEEIADCEDWRSASRFIEKNVFKRNLIDMYSEPAVDFTDRLQSWFMEQSQSKSQ